MPTDNQPCRKAFEKWAESEEYSLDEKFPSGIYCADSTYHAFAGFQAAYEASTPPNGYFKIDLTNHHNAALCPYCIPPISYEAAVEKVAKEIQHEFNTKVVATSYKVEMRKSMAITLAKAALAAMGISEGK